MKFTFKRQPKETGLRAVGNPRPSVDIKLGGKVCGQIIAPYWATEDGKWRVGMAIDSDDPRNGWRWKFFKPRFDTEADARAWIAGNAAALAKLKLYFFEEDEQ